MSKVILCGQDVFDIPAIATFLRECHDADASLIGKVHATLGDMLADRADRLRLDEDLVNLIGFAKCVGVEIVRRSGGNNSVIKDAWRGNVFIVKEDGSNSKDSDVRSKEKQKIAMLFAFANALQFGVDLKEVAHCLLRFQEENNLWKEEDYLDWEE